LIGRANAELQAWRRNSGQWAARSLLDVPDAGTCPGPGAAHDVA
jgi:muconolactone delta-isomerase